MLGGWDVAEALVEPLVVVEADPAQGFVFGVLVAGERAAVDELVLEYPHADRAELSKLIAKAERERLEQRSPVGARELFAFLRQLIG